MEKQTAFHLSWGAREPTKSSCEKILDRRVCELVVTLLKYYCSLRVKHLLVHVSNRQTLCIYIYVSTLCKLIVFPCPWWLSKGWICLFKYDLAECLLMHLNRFHNFQVQFMCVKYWTRKLHHKLLSKYVIRIRSPTITKKCLTRMWKVVYGCAWTTMTMWLIKCHGILIFIWLITSYFAFRELSTKIPFNEWQHLKRVKSMNKEGIVEILYKIMLVIN